MEEKSSVGLTTASRGQPQQEAGHGRAGDV